MGLRSVKFQWQLDGERTAGGGGSRGSPRAALCQGRHFGRNTKNRPVRNFFICLLAEHYYATFGIVLSRPSVVCLWHWCTLPTDLNFSTMCLHHQIAHGLGHFVLKFGAKIRRDSRRSCKLNTRGCDKLAFSTSNSLCCENGTRHGHSYNGWRIWTHVRLMM